LTEGRKASERASSRLLASCEGRRKGKAGKEGRDVSDGF
jgi:hypothetical protein